MARILSKEISEYVGKDIELSGWVNVVRAHGKVLFLDLRDRSGIVQLVFIPSNKELYSAAAELRPEWVISVSGTVNKRPNGMVNLNIANGELEILVSHIHIEAKAKTTPIDVGGDGHEIGEESRMKYRYLDLRRGRMQKNLRSRATFIQTMRELLVGHDFAEIETPVLTRSTPEGARDYLVPSRTEKGKFYALPQSPQQYKQLLMVAGYERYFQVARCFRDEDTRGDRQPEFTQFDIEMSFIEESELMNLMEEVVVKTIEKTFPNKKFAKRFEIMNYADVMAKYNSDKPDLRQDKNDPNELAFLWVIHFPLFEKSEAENRLVSMHHPFTAPETNDIPLLDTDPSKVMARAYDLVLNGYEVGGGSIRINNRELQEKVFETLKIPKEIYEAQFGHLLEALEYGAPAHGGIALGLDRFLSILLNEPNIREVIAFPKTGDGRDLMMDAPSQVSKDQLDELGLKINIKQ
ncbi:MAG: aspartate--tRNA ligase [bacterium]|nr:aspartate--tRNA ligase [bacterium]